MTNEYFTQAIVLDKEPVGEADARVFLYTKILGRVTAQITSARKITSKLNSHLEPLNIVAVRLVKKNNFQVADALKLSSLPVDKLEILHLIKEITPEVEADANLWKIITFPITSAITEDEVLQILGFDKKFAFCQNCGSKNNLSFSTADLCYFCSICCPLSCRKK